jgi:regulator of protease activity HflC (stomatin/prohibitin superfamily)
MSGIAVIVLLVIGIPLLAFAVWQLAQESLVRIDSGSVGILIVRGKTTNRVLTPGNHFILPFRAQMIQGYPLRELTYLADPNDSDEEYDYVDPPVPARLGDRALVAVRYTIRFQIRPDSLQSVHDRFGPDGIHRVIRDESRRVIIAELGASGYGIEDAFGSRRVVLEERLGARMTEALGADGFDVRLFNLRGIELGPLETVIEATVRAKAELELETASAQVRRLRVENELATYDQLAGALSDEVLRYRMVELGREALQRWDGRIVLGDPMMAARQAAPPAAKAKTRAKAKVVAVEEPQAAEEPATAEAPATEENL